MADNTPKTLRNQIMYQIFVRNYSEEGTFAQVEKDLDRIKALGADIVWFMPIHPIGKEKRKGSLGSPYAISDYRAVNPEFGTLTAPSIRSSARSTTSSSLLTRSTKGI